MTTPLRVLIVEDLEDDALLLVRELRKGGYDVAFSRVDTAGAMEAELLGKTWDAVVSDYSLPSFDAPSALRVVRASGLDLPFLIVSRNIGEDLAVAAMKAGAHDYIMKTNLARLVPAMERELREAAGREKRRQAEEALRESERRFRSLIENASDIINVLDEAGRIVYSSPSTERVLGWTPEELRGRRVLECVHPDDYQQTQADFERLLEPDVLDATLQFRFHHKDGRWRHLEASASDLLEDPEVRGIVVNSRDVTDRKSNEETIRHLAYYDALTGLPNRRLFRDRLNQALAYARRHEEGVGVLSLDLDRFKNINDSLGHAVGDRVLKRVAERLASCLRAGDTVSRQGGDEFTVLIPSIEGAEDAAKIAAKILEALGERLDATGHDFHVSASVGVSVFPADGDDEETLIRNADAALHRAKEGGRNCYQLYAPAMNAKAFERLVLESSFRRALERGEFVVHYQPQVNVTTGELTGVEALVRWQHPELGLVLPSQFIPVAEETGLIVPLENWVLAEACGQNRRWQDAGFPRIRMAVNLSARHLKRPDIVETIDGALTASGLDARYLELELTESIVMEDVEETIATLAALKARGVQLAIDDFGTGYSSLSYLKRIPIDTIKIDQSFVRDIPADADDAAIARLIIAIAHSLKLKVIAEGVENNDQLEFLHPNHCDEMQGFLFGRPVPAADLSAFLSACGRIAPRSVFTGLRAL